jgi:hypothetical protein
MSRDYKWIGVGGTFSQEEWYPSGKLMANAVAAAKVLDRSVDVDAWRELTGLRSVFLVLKHNSECDQPLISSIGKQAGVHSFLVEYGWLEPVFLDAATGPWRALGVISVVLGTIDHEAGIPLPALL